VGGQGRTSSIASEVWMDKGMYKSQTARSPGSAKTGAHNPGYGLLAKIQGKKERAYLVIAC